MMRRDCRGAKRLITVAVAAAILLTGAISATRASAATSLAGQWSWVGGTVNVTGSPTSGYTGTSSITVWQISAGGGPAFQGSVNWNDENGNPQGLYPATFTLSGSGGVGSSLKICGTGPQGNYECTSASKLSGGGSAGAGGPNKPECHKNGKPALCPKQKKVVNKAFKALKKTAAAAKGFKAASPQKQANKLGSLAKLGNQVGGTLAKWRKLDLPETKKEAKNYWHESALAKVYINVSEVSTFNSHIAEIATDDAANFPEAKAAFDQAAASRFGRDFNQLTDFEKAIVYKSVWTTELGLGVDPETGMIVHQLYGNSVQTGSAECGICTTQ